uniref:Sleeping Beauty transposase HTH domain-containing protein n=1 Tax=Fundulus heteroclitus TaxID=8078 RepID=A0A3Q2P2Q2_FUNHE
MRTIRLKELPEELRDRIVVRHRSNQGYKISSAALKVPKSTVASIILKWRKFRTTSQPELLLEKNLVHRLL